MNDHFKYQRIWEYATDPKELKFLDKSKFEPGKLVCYDVVRHKEEFANLQEYVDYLVQFFDYQLIDGDTDGNFSVYEILKVKKE